MADQTYLQYLAQQAGGKIPAGAGAALLMAGGRNAARVSAGMPLLTNEELYAARNQRVKTSDIAKLKYGNGKWVNADGSDYVPVFTPFNYAGMAEYPGAAAGRRRQTKEDNGPPAIPGNGLPNGDQPGMGTPQTPLQEPPPDGGQQPPWQSGEPIPRTPPTTPGNYGGRAPPGTGQPPPGAQPPSTGGPNPVTTPPTPPNPQTPSNAWVSSPMKSFDPTQLLLALRGATNFGQNRGVNMVQENLLPWLYNAWVNSRQQSGSGTAGSPQGSPGGALF